MSFQLILNACWCALASGSPSTSEKVTSERLPWNPRVLGFRVLGF